MKQTQRMPRAKRRAQLLTIATIQFVRDGYQASSMDDIAAAAGVTKPVLYQHFDSKDDLYLAVLETIGEDLLAAARRLRHIDGSTHARARFGLVALHDVLLPQGALRLLLGNEYVSPAASQITERILSELARSVAAVLADHRDLGELEALVLGRSLVGVLQSTVEMLREVENAAAGAAADPQRPAPPAEGEAAAGGDARSDDEATAPAATAPTMTAPAMPELVSGLAAPGGSPEALAARRRLLLDVLTDFLIEGLTAFSPHPGADPGTDSVPDSEPSVNADPAVGRTQ